MAHKYRMVSVDAADGTRPNKQVASGHRLNPKLSHQHGAQSESPTRFRSTKDTDGHPVEREVWITHASDHKRSSGLAWVIGIVVLVGVVAIIAAILWMHNVGSTLASVQQGSQQNSRTLAQHGAQLSGIQTQLHNLSNQLSQMQNAMRSMFTNLLAAIRG